MKKRVLDEGRVNVKGNIFKQEIQRVTNELQEEKDKKEDCRRQIRDLESVLEHPNDVHEYRYCQLATAKKAIDSKYREVLKKEHGEPTNWIDRNSEIDEVARDRDAMNWIKQLEAKALSDRIQIADMEKQVKDLKLDLVKLEDKKETCNENNDLLRARAAALERSRQNRQRKGRRNP